MVILFLKNLVFGRLNRLFQIVINFRSGYGGGSTIKNLLALNKNLEIHGIDISKESYKNYLTCSFRFHSRKVVSNLRLEMWRIYLYQNNYFDRIFIFRPIFWKDKKSFQVYRESLISNSALIIASEKEKILLSYDDYRISLRFSRY